MHRRFRRFLFATARSDTVCVTLGLFYTSVTVGQVKRGLMQPRAESPSSSHLAPPQHLRLPAAENQLSQCCHCLTLDTVWVSIKLHQTFFFPALMKKKKCARECDANIKSHFIKRSRRWRDVFQSGVNADGRRRHSSCCIYFAVFFLSTSPRTSVVSPQVCTFWFCAPLPPPVICFKEPQLPE